MAAPREQGARRSRWRRRAVALAVVLFPLLVAGGVLAPRVVSRMADAEIAAVGEPEAPALDFSRPYVGKPPLLPSREEVPAFIGELLDLQRLFGDGQAEELMSRQFARMLGFPRHHGDVIVLDDVDRKIQDVVFKDPILLGTSTDTLAPDPHLLSLDDPRPHGNGLRFDDPQGTGEGQVNPVPEPGTAALLLVGLALFAGCRRPRR